MDAERNVRPEEARWIGDALAKLPADSLSPLIELGSQTLDYRTREKPHIESLVLAPLRARGVRIVHSDLQSGPGIDISGDLYLPQTRAAYAKVGARALLCCNILEHLTDAPGFARICADLLPPGGYAIVTVPRSYPYHLDPIDTMFRPAPSGIAALFPGFDAVAAEELRSGRYLDDLRGRTARDIATELVRIALLRGGLDATHARASRWLWLFRHYRISAVILRKHQA